MKRLFDIVLSTAGLLILLFPCSIIALLIFLQDGHGPFYCQERIGYLGKPFLMIKFRSMLKNAPQGAQLTVGRDPRITGIGHFIRKYKLDELPQLINVWKGEMSLVGPRPEVKRYVDLYNHHQRRVLEVKPGITDYASLEYFEESALLAQSHDPEQTYIKEIMPAKIEINLRYIPNASVREDVRIIALTLVRIVS
jgi:lipopolysaccharide/colanic/teichoic acid biosynthesis glycosyltransferase